MASGIWVSVSGAAAQSQAVDTVANNLANADTIGFKKDQPTFKEYLATVERDHGSVDIPRGPIKNKELYPLDGRDQSFVVVDGTYTNFKPGPLRVTQSPLDIAMDGPGLLEVSTPQGIRYTRQGSLKVAIDGNLVTSEGYPVLSSRPGGLAQPGLAGAARTPAGQFPIDQAATAAQAQADAAGRFINLRDRGTQLTINNAGELYAGDQLIAKLSVAEFHDLNGLRKTGGGMFENKDPANVAEPQKTVVRQGMIEGSNVNPIEEMTNLIKANRLFEEDLKAMKTYGELLGREANDIGKL
ncbi:MAG: flagellar hook basal-body protein [Oligoflexia bacterium]|nr:flagellar hook basal-body protein [Oligoflexia bacterium]